jgi:hypothetical protein
MPPLPFLPPIDLSSLRHPSSLSPRSPLILGVHAHVDAVNIIEKLLSDLNALYHTNPAEVDGFFWM